MLRENLSSHDAELGRHAPRNAWAFRAGDASLVWMEGANWTGSQH